MYTILYIGYKNPWNAILTLMNKKIYQTIIIL